jgi:hypothetical protein
MDARVIVIAALLVIIAASTTTSALIDVLNRRDLEQAAQALD